MMRLADGGLDILQPFQLQALPLGWRPVTVVDAPVIFVLAYQFLRLVLELVEEVWFMVLLPHPHLLPDVTEASELLHRLVAVEDLHMFCEPSLPDLFSGRRCLPRMLTSRLWRCPGHGGLCELFHFPLSHQQYLLLINGIHIVIRRF